MTFCPKCKKYEWVYYNIKKGEKICGKCGTVWKMEDFELDNIIRMYEDRVRERKE